jgi:hypothetical protein
MPDNLMSSWVTGETIGTYEELSDALSQQDVFNYCGQPYTARSLHKMIQRMNKVDEESDFRQQHLPMDLQLKDDDIGLQTPTHPSTPIKRRTTKSDEEEFMELLEQHKGALPKGMRH